MNILDRYLAGAVLGGTLVTLGVLLPLLGFFILADEVDALGTERHGVAEALWFVLLSLPRYGYQVFPIATLIGALVGLGALASRSELVAMRAAGVSIGRIILGALSGGLLLALIAVALGEGVAPLAEQRALMLRSVARTGQAVQVTASGLWTRDGNAFVNIREVRPDARLVDIFIYETEGTSLRVASHAREARYEAGRWLLLDVRRSLIDETGVRVERLPEAPWNSLLDPALLKVIVAEPRVLPVWGLVRYIRFMRASQQDADAHEVALWGRLTQPLLVLAMIFVAIPVVLGSARSTGLGLRIFLGILIGIAFYLVSRTFAYLALLYEFDPALAAFMPPLLFVGVALWLLRRVG